MRIVIRIFAMSVALAGLATSSFSSPAMQTIPSHLSATAHGHGPLSLPIPTCGPGVPTCGPNGGGGNTSSSSTGN